MVWQVTHKHECLWGVDIEFTILMRKVKSLLKQTTPLKIGSAPFLNSQECGNKTAYLPLIGWLCFQFLRDLRFF